MNGPDIIADLGLLTLGSRFKRLGDRLQADVARFFAEQGVDLQPAQAPLLLAVETHGPISVGDLAAVVGVAQPGVTRALSRLTERGLVAVDRGERDQRQKAVRLTPAGQAMTARMRDRLFAGVGGGVAELCEGLTGPLLDQLSALEARLETEPLDRRALRHAKDETAL
jgi:DNA-binding MarR family transcriptional regulator